MGLQVLSEVVSEFPENNSVIGSYWYPGGLSTFFFFFFSV